MRYLLACGFLALCFSACKPPVYTPKPKAYYRIDLPEHRYIAFDKADYPFSFEYPEYSYTFKDTLTTDGRKPENKYWMNIDFPQWNARIYLSYKRIGGKDNLNKLLGDTHEMSYYHTKKADYINPKESVNPFGVTVIAYSVGGNAASAYQFIATDTAKHFLRGSLYFNVTPNADSLKPMNEFLKKDIAHLINTLQWKD